MPVKSVPTLGWRRESVAATILQVTQDQRDQMAVRARKLMEDKRYTNASLAYEAKVSEKTVSRLINGKREPRYDTIERIAKALDVTAEALTGPPPAPLGLGEESQLDRIERKIDDLRRLMDELAAEGIEAAVRQALPPESQRRAAKRPSRAA